MKLHSVVTQGIVPQTKFELRKMAGNDPMTIQILQYMADQNEFLRSFGENPISRHIPGYVKIGFHNHFPKIEGWYDWGTGRFNPEKLEEFAEIAYKQGFGIVSLSNYGDDSVFEGKPGIKFEFKSGHIIVLRSQESLDFVDVMPIGYTGRVTAESLERLIESTIYNGGLVVFPHPANRAYNGAGEENVSRYRNKAVIETQNILANGAPFFRFADILPKEWSLKYCTPGISGIDSHNLYMPGGFYVHADLLDMSSPESAIASLVRVFHLRRMEMRESLSLCSDLIINTEDYPAIWTMTRREGIPQIVASFKYGARKYLKMHS
jgi:hypothetical protein